MHLSIAIVIHNLAKLYSQYSAVETANVRETLAPGAFVYQAKACDLDLPPFNGVRYRLYAGDGNLVDCPTSMSEYFTINEDNGTISTKVMLNREDASVRLVCVEAMQKLSRRRRATPDVSILRIKVNILDVNDNPPAFLNVVDIEKGK